MSGEYNAFDSVLPNANASSNGGAGSRPRTRGARRRALPMESVFKTGTPTKKSKKLTAGKPPVANEASLFPALGQQPQRLSKLFPSPQLSAPLWTEWTETAPAASKQAEPISDRRDELSAANALVQRLHASGIQRSHAQTKMLLNIPPSTLPAAASASNQHTDASLPPRRPSMPINHTSTNPLTAPPRALHPSSDGILIPTRPITSSSTLRPVVQVRAPSSTTPRAALGAAVDNSSVESPRMTKKVPLTARDKFYMDQRAMTAPSYASGQSPRHRPRPQPQVQPQPTPPVNTAATTAAAPRAKMATTSTEGADNDGPRRTEIFSGGSGFKTFTETLAEDLRRGSAVDTRKKSDHNSGGGGDAGSVNSHAVGVASDSFLYLRRVDSNPYHLAVTNHTKIQPDDYYTVSRLGVTHFAHNSSEFIPLEKFERENYIYSLLVKLPFFRKYRLWKRFTLWKQEINDRKRTMATLSLNQNLFVLLPHLHEALMQLRGLCIDLQRVKLFDFEGASGNDTDTVVTWKPTAHHHQQHRHSSMGTGGGLTGLLSPPQQQQQQQQQQPPQQRQQPQTYTLAEFSVRLKSQKMDCEKQIDQFVGEAAMIAKNACELYLFAFLQETGFNEPRRHGGGTSCTSGSGSGFSSTTAKAPPPPPSVSTSRRPTSAAEALEMEQEMTYTERATMRTQCRKITKFLRVVEFLISDALLRVAISSAQKLQHEMAKIKDGLLPTSATSIAATASQAAVNAAIMARYKHAPLFRVEVSLLHATSSSSTFGSSSRGGLVASPPPMLAIGSSSLSSSASRSRLSMRRQSSMSTLSAAITTTGGASAISQVPSSTTELLVYTPHQETLRSQLETLIFNGLKVVTTRDRLLSNAIFKAYVDAGLDDGLGGGEGEDEGGGNGGGGEGELSSEGMDLDILILEDAAFVETMQNLNAIIQEAFSRADTSCSALLPFLNKYHANLAFCVRVVNATFVYAVQVDELRDLLEKYTKEIDQFNALPEQVPCGLLLLDNGKLNMQLKPSPRKCLEQLHIVVPLVIQYKNEKLTDELTKYNDKISAIPISVDEYAETLAFLRHLQSQMETVEGEYLVLKSLYQLIEEYNVKISDIDHTNAFLLSQRRAQLKTSMDLFENSCETYTEKFGIELEARVPTLVATLTELVGALSHEKLFQCDSDPFEMVEYLCGVENQIKELEHSVERHSFFEKTLALPHSNAFDELGEVRNELVLKNELWNGLQLWNTLTKAWDPQKFPRQVDVALITDQVVVFYSRILQWETQLSPGTGPLCAFLKARVEDYRVTMPILHDLKCPRFEERHYKELQTLLGFSIRGSADAAALPLETTINSSSGGSGRKPQALLQLASPPSLTRMASRIPEASASQPQQQQLTLGQLVQMKLAPFAAQVNRIATDATQERLLKESLDKIIAVWEKMEFDVRAYKDSKDYCMLVGNETIYASLEESLVSLTSLLNSKYLAPIKDAANTWQRRLALFQETLDAWIECQRKWMHLETIFSAPDIQKQLPNESMLFTTVNQFWKDLMRKTREHRNCMKVSGATPHVAGTVANLLGSSALAGSSTMGMASFLASSLAPSTTNNNIHAGQISLLETLNRHNGSLDKIEKSLEDYLETKRGFFPRFYFISNDELLEMLAHAKEPQSVQRHLCKCFDALVKLEISEDVAYASNGNNSAASTGGAMASSGMGVGASVAAASSTTGSASSSSSSLSSAAHDILAMISPEGERVAFSRSLKARGNVEDWLNAVLSNMKVTLQRHMKSCIQDYQHASREAWMFRHPAQCVAVVSYIMWARECEVCFHSASNDPLKELAIWHQTICSQLSNLTRLVRTSLTKVQRCLVVSLVTTDVHFRDVVEDLIVKRVTSGSDFIWAQQLRYYWHTDHDECVAQQANFKIKYGYEYMGACSRLVITPLTDRCWMTITGALALSFGAAPSGPAGTGKTETSKDLAKALGTLCIVFNCSDQIDYKMMAKIFNGAFQSGSWTCLDEFNRIDIEVLSVVAQQMTTIRHARLRGANDVLFEGKNVPMRDHHIIITMNPGYVGRTELPDNLKVCFRPVAMMVPDYALIAEILLFAEGFQHAKPLSKKITKLYKLCSEQLSQQPHYDFGMRAVKSVLLIAGSLKRSQLVVVGGSSGAVAAAAASGATQDESLTLLKAMQDANIPKFVDHDITLFHGILRDLFPDELVVNGGGSTAGSKMWSEYDAMTSSTPLSEEIDRQILQQGLVSTPKWKQKVLQLFETLEVRIGVVQTGASGSGKSVAFRILTEAMTSLRDTKHHPDKRFQRVISYILNPKSIAMNELYGFFHPLTREWTDGLASSILRQCITEKSESMAASTKSSSSSSGGGDVRGGGAGAAVDSSTNGPFYWITFDGPIDVLWIESMNTVLDDNMTLCLANGERIKLLAKIQLLFEVSDTSSASPATISRLGVVYYHPSYLGWRPVVESWVNALAIPTVTTSTTTTTTATGNGTTASSPVASPLNSPTKDPVLLGQFASATPTGLTAPLNARLRLRLVKCFELFVEPGLHFIRSSASGGRAAVPTSDVSFISSLCSIFETLLLRRAGLEVFASLHTPPQTASAATTASAAAASAALESHQNRCVDLAFVFSFIWAFGGNLVVDKWKNEFQELVFQLLETNESFFSRDLLAVSGKIQTRLSQVNDNFFDFFVDFQFLSFVPWENLSRTSSSTGSGASSAGGLSVQSMAPLEFHPEMPLFQLIVPTLDMTKYSYLTRLLALDGMLPVYLTGMTGAGKSVLVHHLLRGGGGGGSGASARDRSTKIFPISISFSAQTSSLVTQLTIESKLVKKRKTLLGAPVGTQAVIFIDDVNMPSVEAHGAQPPIELLRQYLEYRGIYDRDKFFWKEICDVVLIAAGGLPGGGRRALCPRFMRQFSAILCMPSSDEAAMKTIFNAILAAHLGALSSSIGSAGVLPKPLKEAAVAMVDATVVLYEAVSKTLLPTPSKSYYLFNLRDVTKLMQGVVLGAKWCGVDALSLDFLAKLWAHESIRVFRDRLMDESDKKWFSEQLVTLANRNFGVSWTIDHVHESSDATARRRSSVSGGALSALSPGVGSASASAAFGKSPAMILFAPHAMRQDEKGAKRSHQPYQQVDDMGEFEQHLNDVMDQYLDDQAASSPPRLVFFQDAMVHIAAIARILIQPRGHALLLGIAGSGKRSLARMACFLMDYHCYEIELTKNYSLADFREMLKSTMVVSVLGKKDRGRSGGVASTSSPSPSLTHTNVVKPTVLLLNESQLISEQFVEDINALLNGGEIPKLFPLDEYEKMLSDVRSLLTAQHAVRSERRTTTAATSAATITTAAGTKDGEVTRADCESYFHTQVQRAMHIIICHSPVSDVFRTRIRQFPSLVNCMTIDYFDAWPSHALQYVAGRFLTREHTTPLGRQPAAVASAAVAAATELPSSARHAVAVLCMEVHQSVVASASDFLVRCKRHIYFTPKHFVDLIGMVVRVYKEQQQALQEKLTRLSVGVIKLEETNALVSTLQEELVALQPILQNKTIEAEQLLHQVGIDQQEAGQVAARVAQDEARVKQQQREVSSCQADAQKDLDMALPALNAAVHALDSLDKKDITEVKAFIKPPLAVQVVMEAVCIMLGEKADWDTSKRVLSRATFMNELKEYDKDTINAATLKKIRKYIDNPDFAVDEVKKVSRAAMSLCMWVHAMDTYARIYKDVAPKRQRLAEMNGVLADANAKLAAKQNELAQVMSKVQTLKDQCDTTLAEKQRLVHESELTQARLQRAERLMVGLEDERVRWKENIEQLKIDGKAVLGDAFIAAAAISYLGPFNGVFRSRIMRQWTQVASRSVEISPGFSLVDSYGDAMELREWELLGLPSDVVSTENALFVMKGNQQRWPLLIDPQQQATQWIQRLEAPNSLECIKAQDRALLQVVERTLRDGVPLLVQDVNEHSLEQALEPLLLKAFLPIGASTAGPSAGLQSATAGEATKMKNHNKRMMQVKLGDRLVPVEAAHFRLYLVTQIPNPHFVPDVFIRTNVINFTVTSEGLTEQLLGDVVRRERPEVEERKHNLLYSITQDQKMLQQMEIKILSMLSESKGNILDDLELIQALETAKHTSRVVTVRLQESQVTKQQLLQVRNQYESVAVRGALLFFVVADLTAIDAMYQYSLEYFRRLFITSLDGAAAQQQTARGKGDGAGDLETRLASLLTQLMAVVYRNIARGLFDAHKLVFSALICFRMAILANETRPDELKLLDAATFTGSSSSSSGSSSPNGPSSSSPSTGTSATGSEVDPIDVFLALAGSSQAFAQLLESYKSEPSAWTEWTTSSDPYDTCLPGMGDQLLTNFQRLVLVRWLRDDAWTLALRHFVQETLGGDPQFVETSVTSTSSSPSTVTATDPPRSPMGAIYSDMDKLTPCLFILSSGADPISLLTQFAMSELPGVFPDKYRMISLGQGQGPIAERLLEQAAADGNWLILQNIHLAKSWIPRLEELLSSMSKPEKKIDVHDEFRLFLTSFPVSYFPISILQNAVKVTNEPPKGIKANLQRSMGLIATLHAEEEEDGGEGGGGKGKGEGASNKEPADAIDVWVTQMERQMVFGLSFFHAVIQERFKFGANGWNLKYDFSDADFQSVVTLQRHLLLDLSANYHHKRRVATLKKQQKQQKQNQQNQQIQPGQRRRSSAAYVAEEAQEQLPGEDADDDDDDDEDEDEDEDGEDGQAYGQFGERGSKSLRLDVDDVPWDALHFLTGEIYYGGRVTDEFDRRCLMSNLQRFCSPRTVVAAAATSPGGGGAATGADWDETSGQQQQQLHSLFSCSDSSFAAPAFASHREMADFVEALPSAAMDAPFVFGMHPNANVFYLKRETQRVVAQVLQLQAMHQQDEGHGQAGGASPDPEEQEDDGHLPQLVQRGSSQLDGKSQRLRTSCESSKRSIVTVATSVDNTSKQPEAVALYVAKEIQQKLPRPSRMAASPSSSSGHSDGHGSDDLPDPFSVVLQQELAKCNTLLATVHDGLQDLQRAIQGHIAMSSPLDAILQSLWQQQVPLEWRKLDGASSVADVSSQSLALWVTQIQFRIGFLLQWETLGNAPQGIYPLSIFCFPQGFFTAILQRHARKYVVAIHHLEFQFMVLRESFLTSRKHHMRRHQTIRTQSVVDIEAEANKATTAAAASTPGAAPPGLFDGMDGAFISGLFLEGAQWSDDQQCLVEPKPGVMHHAMPVIHVVPQVNIPAAPSTTLPASGGSSSSSSNSSSMLIPGSQPVSRTKAMTPSYLTLRTANSFASFDIENSHSKTNATTPSGHTPASSSSLSRRSHAVAPLVVMTNKYVCPLYKTRARKGTLSTTGSSTNFVLAIELACEKSPDHYALNGTALVSNLVM